ncbi:hypothetical protein ES703_67895 [subsurface metagenome]
MSVSIAVILSKTVDDIDKGNDFVDEVRELLAGNVTCKLQSQSSNCSSPEELTKEQESE